MALGATVNSATEPTTGELLGQFSDQISRLVRNEVVLAQQEVRRKMAGTGRTAVLLGLGIGLLLLGAGAVVAGAVLALALALPAWVSALIVGVVLVIFGAIFASVARGRVKRAGLPVPEEAISSMSQNLKVVMAGARR